MTVDPDPAHVFLTVEEVASRYKVSKDTIWRWKRDGRFPKAVRVGPGATRWRLSELLEFDSKLQSCLVTDVTFLEGSPFLENARDQEGVNFGGERDRIEGKRERDA